jgi:phage repressor protein C with HTH and peptisase S24 domain
MTTAQELRSKLKPLVQEEEKVIPTTDRTESAWNNLILLMEEAVQENKGGLDVYLDTILDQYWGMAPDGYNYSAQAILKKLEQNNYEVEELEDHTDAIVIRITWDKTYPLYKNTAHRGSTHFYLKDT